MSRTATMSAEHKPLLAERFKTKTCRTYTETGSCPYEARCMFAHGAADLRTAAMNMADGLTTEDAIRAFQRNQAKKASVLVAAVKPQPSAIAPTVRPKQATPMPSVVAKSSPELPSACMSVSSTADAPFFAAGEVSCETIPMVATPVKAVRRQHNPYAPVVLATPSASMSPIAAVMSRAKVVYEAPVTAPAHVVLLA